MTNIFQCKNILYLIFFYAYKTNGKPIVLQLFGNDSARFDILLIFSYLPEIELQTINRNFIREHVKIIPDTMYCNHT